ncbi:MAG: cytidine deaminase [Candidatus Methanoliparum thermophilum]|uniref:Cytidine deaminase n=1 Tax=Methanoliparum thermophilum TaxID=2491083 RepID=A0A520KTB1_METT2|nr:cytidine/deoxycytidylate deaminase family protein [Candidatus Methanoliparum sp. LAM-1]RZN65190.1 MAG: cytidine deaminase [Candidatus Methanoliparum thermophilum]BDC36626.1 cytidine deaminase [Candidatus Methanoliparum sp. LAM-1]
MNERPNIDEYFMNIAKIVATRSTCLRNHVGAVIVKDKRILTTGYNGAPSGLPHCLDIGCLRNSNNIPSGKNQEICRGVHAEQNAIIQAALHGISIKDATLYCTHLPCSLCAKMLINAHIKRVVYSISYPDEMSLEYFNKAGISVELYKGDITNQRFVNHESDS